MNHASRFSACCAALISLLPATRALGTQLTFNIDPTQSYMSFAVTSGRSAFGVPLFPGSDMTSMSGTMNVDVTPSTVQFLLTGNTQLALQPQNVGPAPGGGTRGAPGSAPGAFGLFVLFGARSYMAVRNQFGASSSVIADVTSGAIPLSASAFDASRVTPFFRNAEFDYYLNTPNGTFQGSQLWEFLFVQNWVSGGTLTSSGGIDTLTLPILFYNPFVAGQQNLGAVFSGQIVATALVPEPPAFVIGGFGLLGLVAWGWRRRRCR